MLLSRNGIDSLLSIYKGYATVKIVDNNNTVISTIEYFDMAHVYNWMLLFSKVDEGFIPHAIAKAYFNERASLVVDKSSVEILRFKMESFVIDQFTVKEFLLFSRLLDPLFEYEELDSIVKVKQIGSFVHYPYRKMNLFFNTVILNKHDTGLYSIDNVIYTERETSPVVDIYKILAINSDELIINNYRNDELCIMYKELFGTYPHCSIIEIIKALRDNHQEFLHKLERK